MRRCSRTVVKPCEGAALALHSPLGTRCAACHAHRAKSHQSPDSVSGSCKLELQVRRLCDCAVCSVQMAEQWIWVHPFPPENGELLSHTCAHPLQRYPGLLMKQRHDRPLQSDQPDRPDRTNQQPPSLPSLHPVSPPRALPALLPPSRPPPASARLALASSAYLQRGRMRDGSSHTWSARTECESNSSLCIPKIGCMVWGGVYERSVGTDSLREGGEWF